MSRDEDSSPTSQADRLKELDRRLRERQAARREHEARKPHAAATGLGIAWRMSVELVASIGVGAGLGYGIDHLAGTRPWIMVLGVGFGFAAGVRNTVRTATKLQDAVSSDAESGDGNGET